MPKAATLLAALVASTFCYASAKASIGPQSSSESSPATDLPAEFSSPPAMTDTRLEVGGEIGLIAPHRPDAPHKITTPQLSLGPFNPHTFIYTEFAVGRQEVSPLQAERPNAFTFRSPASTHFAEESNFLRSVVVGRDFLETLGDRFDLQDDDERPNSTTTTVHVLSSTRGWIAPFATLAYEEDSLEINDRIGLGGGVQFKFDNNTSFGAETIYFADRVNDSLPRETRFLARFEFDF